MLESVAVIKSTCFDHIDRHVGQSLRREYSYNLQRKANYQENKRKRYVDKDRNPKSVSAEMRRNEIQTELINVNSMQQQ